MAKQETQDICETYILTLTCADKPGIVAAIAGILAEMGCNIEESSQYGDAKSGCFFMRVSFAAPQALSFESIKQGLEAPATQYAMRWGLTPAREKMRSLIMVSKMDHCLRDLLYRKQLNTLPLDIVGVASNHETCRAQVEQAGLPYHYLPITKETKLEQEGKLREIITAENVELVILARYMQVLSNEMSDDFFGKVINIHHSFLPGFKGAKPYHRAYERGVKLIGATAHYVTADLDEGPIIEQETERVDHSMSVGDMIAAGRDIERLVLSRAVKYHAEHRVLLNGDKTVVFK